MRLQNILKTLGPGILFASTAIGVSHLVQSTRAGANYGFALVGLILLTNLMKYPFFEYGSRYANATGTSIIEGYKKIGNWMLVLYYAITLVSMFLVCAAVGAVTAGFMDNLFGLKSTFGIEQSSVVALLFLICIGILLIGKFNVLDKLIKVIGTVLLLSTLLAFFLALYQGPVNDISAVSVDVWDVKHLPFIIALMGWMPTAVDLSTWNSLWTVERIKSSGYKPTLKETLLDFNLGYIASAVLAVCFVTLGTYMMFGSNEELPNSSSEFAGKVVEMYTITMGDWSYLIIASAAFSIMFGTAIAVFDGYARAMEKTNQLLFFKDQEDRNKKLYAMILIVVAIVSYVIITQFGSKLKQLVDLATTISFIIAPIIATVNFVLVGKKYVGEDAAPKLWLRILSYLGILFLSGFTLFYLLN